MNALDGGTGAKWLRGHAVVGALIWLASWFALPDRGSFMGFLEWVVIFALLVVTPLGLALLDRTPASRFSRPLVRFVHLLQPLAGYVAAVSFLLPTGPLAAAAAAPWAAVAAFLALAGVLGIPNLRTTKIRELPAWAAHFFFPFGAAWVVMSRAGLSLPSLRGTIGEPIVILTAVHFHFMGLGLPILVDRIGRALPERVTRRPLVTFCFLAIVAGPPTVALGFVVDGAFQVSGALVLALAVVAFSVLSLVFVVPKVRGLAKAALAVSALAGMWATPLGFAYTLVQFVPEIGITIPWMVRFHGIVQAFGLVFCGLLAWTWAAGRHAAGAQRAP